MLSIFTVACKFKHKRIDKYDPQEECGVKEIYNRTFSNKKYIISLCYDTPNSYAVQTQNLDIKIYDDETKDLMVMRRVDVIYNPSGDNHIDISIEEDENKIYYFDVDSKTYTIDMPPTKED